MGHVPLQETSNKVKKRWCWHDISTQAIRRARSNMPLSQPRSAIPSKTRLPKLNASHPPPCLPLRHCALLCKQAAISSISSECCRPYTSPTHSIPLQGVCAASGLLAADTVPRSYLIAPTAATRPHPRSPPSFSPSPSQSLPSAFSV